MSREAPIPHAALDQLGERRIEKLLKKSASRPDPDEGRLCCRQCGARITRETHRIERGGAHSHTFTNPHQIPFTLGCFTTADGCRCQGHASMEHTWFPGYAWRIALCSACSNHLGWRFENGGERFFGLILDQLVTCGPRAH